MVRGEEHFTGKVVEVVNGDTIMVKVGGKVSKVYLTLSLHHLTPPNLTLSLS